MHILAYSGARYPNVPATLVIIDLSVSLASLTNPKSDTLARKSWSSSILEGFRSICPVMMKMKRKEKRMARTSVVMIAVMSKWKT